MSLDHAAALVEARAPDFFRGVMAAPPEKRPYLLALLALDIELYAAQNASNEEMVNAVKLAWWRDQLARLPEGQENHPVLTALVAANVEQGDALEIVELYQSSQDSLRKLVDLMAKHLDTDPAPIHARIDAQAENRVTASQWKKNARPIVLMISKFTPAQRLKLVFWGRG